MIPKNAVCLWYDHDAEAAAREGWQLDEIHTEEGRLDEVFRTITLPDTVRTAETVAA